MPALKQDGLIPAAWHYSDALDDCENAKAKKTQAFQEIVGQTDTSAAVDLGNGTCIFILVKDGIYAIYRLPLTKGV